MIFKARGLPVVARPGVVRGCSKIRLSARSELSPRTGCIFAHWKSGVIEIAMRNNEVPEYLWDLEARRLGILLNEWMVQCELPRQPFHVVQTEQKQRIDHEGILMDVIIDRIDRVDGCKVLIDYKTGVNNNVNTWADERIANPQLPLYVLTDSEIEAASFAQVAKNQCRYVGLAKEPETLPRILTKIKSTSGSNAEEPISDWTGWRAHWQASLNDIAQELKSGIATVTPMKSACTYCELTSLCRITEDSASADTEGNEADTAVFVVNQTTSLS